MKKGINNPGFRALPSSVQNNIISNMKYGGNTFNQGGPMQQLTEFDEGGRHEENGLGGIPQGMNPDGQMNLVEEGETKFDAENYIFSDSLKVDKELAEAFNLNPKMVGKTFAEASKVAGRKKSKREGDAIEMAANDRDLMNLMEAQEAFKQKEIEEKLEEINQLDPNALPAMMGQGQDPNMMGAPGMGGQMQEAPMTEQEAMMAQQGGPSPEEMAMMQDQMMGQQEGMMRGGGPLYKYAYGGNMSQADYLRNRQMTTYDPNYKSYQPGGFMEANPCPCDTPGCPPCNPAPKNTGYVPTTIDIVGRQNTGTQVENTAIGGLAFSPNLSSTPASVGSEERLLQDLRQNMLSNRGAYATTKPDSSGSSIGNINIPPMELSGINWEKQRRQKRRQERLANRQGLTVDQWKAQGPILHHDKKGWIKSRLPFTPRTEPMRLSEKSFFDLPWSHEKRGNIKTYKYKNLGGPLNQMRRGGKLCYGCGGAMHAYGGRMDGLPGIQHKYGAGLQIFDKITDVASPILKATGVGIPVAMALKAAGDFAGHTGRNMQEEGIETLGEAVGSGKMNVKENVIKSSLSGLTAGVPGIEALNKVPGIEGVIDSGINLASDAITGPEGKSDFQLALEKGDPAAIAKHEEMQKSQNTANLVNTGLGIAGNIASANIKPKSPSSLPTATLIDNSQMTPIDEAVTDTEGYIGDEVINRSYADIDTGRSYNNGGKMFNNGGKLTLSKTVEQPDGTTVNKYVTYNSLQELLADKELVMKYGGEENVKELFAARFKDANVPYQTSLMDNVTPPAPVYDPPIQQVPVEEKFTTSYSDLAQRQAYLQKSLSPEKLAEIEAIQNLERRVDTENPVFTPDPRFTEDLDKNKIPDYLEMSNSFDPTKDKEIIDETSDVVEKAELDDEVPVDPTLEDKKFDFEYKETFPQFAAKMAGPLYNIGSGLFSKPKDYTPDFIPLDVPKFDPTQALNNVKRQVSGIRRQLNKVGANPSNLLALAQSGSRLENETLMTYDKLQKELDFRGEQYNKGQKQQIEKYKKQLEMSFDEAKRKSIQEGIKQIGQIQQTEAANYLAAQYNAMAAPSLGTFSYTPFLQGLFNKNNKKKKD